MRILKFALHVELFTIVVRIVRKETGQYTIMHASKFKGRRNLR